MAFPEIWLYYIGKSETMSFKVRTFYDVVEESGIKIKVGRESRVSLKRPKHLYIQSDSDNGSATTIWFNGSKLTIWERAANKVMSLDYSGTTESGMCIFNKTNITLQHDGRPCYC